MRGGAFGGTYFRDITSSVTGISYVGKDVVEETLHPSWYNSLDIGKFLTSQKYDSTINRNGAKCGASLGTWESSGWISDVDPYGWFQWYCRFYKGRRCDDDERQIKRWAALAGEKGRFRSQLSTKIVGAGCDQEAVDDQTISPVVRQTLWHWGLELTLEQIMAHKKRKGL